MEDISQMKKGRLIIGSMPITGATIMPLILPAFRAMYPQIEVTLVEETSANLEILTASGETDFSLLMLPLQHESLLSETIYEEEIVLSVPPKHPLAARKSRIVDIAELAEEPFIALKKGQGLRKLTHELCSDAGFSPNIVFESSVMETVQSLVAAGMGIAFVPYMISRRFSGDLSLVNLQLSSKPTRTLVIAYKKGRYLSKAAEAFKHTIIEIMKRQA
jgi:LysR family transcriptional regulator, hydrogen peroxide-inducible genes activator